MTSKSLLLVFLIMIFYSKINLAQLSLRLNLEGGYYRSTSTSAVESGQKDATARIDGEVGYKYKDDNRFYSFKLRARPEVYGLQNNLKIFKLKAAGNYYFTGNNITYGFNLNGQRNNYGGRDIDLTFQDFIFAFESLLTLDNNFSASANLGYGYQKVSENINQKMDLLFLDTEIFQDVFSNARLGYGVYSERFVLNGVYKEDGVNNKGWRVGPHISLNYLKAFLANFDYRFLFHISEITKSPSYEHWIRLVAGKLFSENWSVFILTDYYFRKYTISKVLNNPYISLYTPINEDNRIYLKVAYSLSDIFETYIKTGYFRENLFNNYSFAGWNLVAGFEIEK